MDISGAREITANRPKVQPQASVSAFFALGNPLRPLPLYDDSYLPLAELLSVRSFVLTIVFVGWAAVTGQTVGLLLQCSPRLHLTATRWWLPAAATRTHLIDNCGRVINQWDSDYRAGESAYLLEDGSSAADRPPEAVEAFNGGGIGGRVERFNWEGDLVWSYELATDTAHHHHDMAFLPKR